MLLVIALSFGAGVWAAPYVRAQVLPAPTPPADLNEQMAPFWQAWSLVEQHFAFKDNVDHQKMVYGAIQGMLSTLDDEGHTRFLSPDEVKLEQSNLQGRFEGIGAEVGTRNGRPTIVAPIEGSPAERAGIRSGDVIVRVDGQDVSGLTLTEIVSRIRGPKGSAVQLQVLHPGASVPTELAIVREQIQTQMVTWAMLPGTTVAHIRISQFGQQADAELKQAIAGARAAGATGLVVDIRNNPGGLLDQAVAVSSEFEDNGVVLLQEDRDGRRRSFPVRRGGVAIDLPMVVLTNEGSASASEIFAGAMQDDGRAVVVGAKTFGTGTVLTSFPLGDGSVVLLGTAQWLTPSGRAIRKQGIKPDVPVQLPANAEMLAPRAERTMTSGELQRSADAQLLRGLELVQAGRTAPAATLRGRNSLVYAH
jgi:carboxyl-terminal processing protease